MTAAPHQSAAGQPSRRQDDEVSVQSSVPSSLYARCYSGPAGSGAAAASRRPNSQLSGGATNKGARSNDSHNRSAGASPTHHDASVDESKSKSVGGGAEASSVSQRRLKAAVEQDLQFLQNRLAKLKLEEARAKGDILELRKKTDEVVATQEQQQKTSTMKKALNTQVDYGKRKEAAMIALNRERQAKAVWASKQKMMLDRKEAVAAMRKEKEMNECRVKLSEEERREKNTQQRETVRQIQMTAKEKREQEELHRKEEQRRLYQQRCEDQAREREEKERLAAQLIAEEAQMIYRLKLLHGEKQRQLEKLAAVVERGPSALSEMPEEGGDDMYADEEEDAFDHPSPVKREEDRSVHEPPAQASAQESPAKAAKPTAEAKHDEPKAAEPKHEEPKAATSAKHEEPKAAERPPSAKGSARADEQPKKAEPAHTEPAPAATPAPPAPAPTTSTSRPASAQQQQAKSNPEAPPAVEGRPASAGKQDPVPRRASAKVEPQHSGPAPSNSEPAAAAPPASDGPRPSSQGGARPPSSSASTKPAVAPAPATEAPAPSPTKGKHDDEEEFTL